MTIPTPTGPSGIVVHLDLNRLYVATFDGLTVIDLSDNSVLTTISTGTSPIDVMVTCDRAWVTDTTTLFVLTTVGVGNGPTGIGQVVAGPKSFRLSQRPLCARASLEARTARPRAHPGRDRPKSLGCVHRPSGTGNRDGQHPESTTSEPSVVSSSTTRIRRRGRLASVSTLLAGSWASRTESLLRFSAYHTTRFAEGRGVLEDHTEGSVLAGARWSDILDNWSGEVTSEETSTVAVRYRAHPVACRNGYVGCGGQ